MTVHLATFSDESMSRSRQLCIESALKHGVDSIAGPHYFDPGIEYRDGFTLEWLKSQPIYEQMSADWWTQRGIGYWLWKPYIIDLVMSKLRDGDLIVYADAGVEFVNNIRYITDRMDQDIFLFGNNWEHAHWCKADVVKAAWPAVVDSEIISITEGVRTDKVHARSVDWSDFGKQCQASVIFFRVSDYPRAFVAEWLKWCLHEGGRLIDDSPSIAPNHPEFREHRHDQAILTTLVYREGIKLHAWPAVYNRFLGQEFVYSREGYPASDDYPSLFHHHRLRDSEFEALKVKL